MSFTYDVTTVIGQVRVLIGDTVSGTAKFQDEEISAFLSLTSQSVYLACALACNAEAAKIGSQLQEIQLGDFRDYSGRNQVAALQQQAERFTELEYNTPAWGVVEENLSGFNELIIIRNWVLRTEPPLP